MARHVLVIGAELLTRFLDYTDRSTCILFGDGAGAVVVSASDEPAGPHGIELTTDPQGAYMIWLPAGGSKSPSSAETVARGEHFIRMEGSETYRFATRTLASSALTAIERAGLRPDEIDLFDPAPGQHPDHRGRGQGPRLPDGARSSSTSTATGTPPRRRSRWRSPRRSTAAGSSSATGSSSSPSGPASRPARWRWSGRWTRRMGPAPRPSDSSTIHVRAPVDWDSVDPIPPQLAAVLAAPGPVDVPLDDVVPGEPEHAHKEVLA